MIETSHFPDFQTVRTELGTVERKPAKHVWQVIVGDIHNVVLKALHGP